MDMNMFKLTTVLSVCVWLAGWLAGWPGSAGTRISVDGHGEGVYQAWSQNVIGANDHTVHFDRSGRQEVQLKPLTGKWFVV
jgi:hypothetical protein